MRKAPSGSSPGGRATKVPLLISRAPLPVLEWRVRLLCFAWKVILLGMLGRCDCLIAEIGIAKVASDNSLVPMVR